IRASIDRDPADRQRMKGYADHRTGKPAVTHYRRLENWGPVSLMEFTLETGRTHQIRVHTSMNGFPIFNDSTYGGDALVRGPQRGSYRSFVAQCMRDMPRMALHAKTLGFVHPDTGQNLFFDSELPADFEGVLKAWKTWALQET
ncbi:MAG: RluA family pseudouridine synthase, partial [Bacteroidia bacterium]